MEKALTPKNIEIAAKAFYEASCDDKWDDTIELEREWYLASMEVALTAFMKPRRPNGRKDREARKTGKTQAVSSRNGPAG